MIQTAFCSYSFAWVFCPDFKEILSSRCSNLGAPYDLDSNQHTPRFFGVEGRKHWQHLRGENNECFGTFGSRCQMHHSCWVE
jgi:hypothetical protein